VFHVVVVLCRVTYLVENRLRKNNTFFNFSFNMQVGTMAMSYAFFLDFNVFVYVQ